VANTDGVPTPTENANSPENYHDDGLDEEAYAQEEIEGDYDEADDEGQSSDDQENTQVDAEG